MSVAVVPRLALQAYAEAAGPLTRIIVVQGIILCISVSQRQTKPTGRLSHIANKPVLTEYASVHSTTERVLSARVSPCTRAADSASDALVDGGELRAPQVEAEHAGEQQVREDVHRVQEVDEPLCCCPVSRVAACTGRGETHVYTGDGCLGRGERGRDGAVRAGSATGLARGRAGAYLMNANAEGVISNACACARRQAPTYSSR